MVQQLNMSVTDFRNNLQGAKQKMRQIDPPYPLCLSKTYLSRMQKKNKYGGEGWELLIHETVREIFESLSPSPSITLTISDFVSRFGKNRWDRYNPSDCILTDDHMYILTSGWLRAYYHKRCIPLGIPIQYDRSKCATYRFGNHDYPVSINLSEKIGKQIAKKAAERDHEVALAEGTLAEIPDATKTPEESQKLLELDTYMWLRERDKDIAIIGNPITIQKKQEARITTAIQQAVQQIENMLDTKKLTAGGKES